VLYQLGDVSVGAFADGVDLGLDTIDVRSQDGELRSEATNRHRQLFVC
jgi:hypothetical protein